MPPEVDAASYAVFDLTSRRWLGEHDADTQRPVGSVMKLLTAYTVMQAGDPGRNVDVPAAALGGSEDESRIWLYEGQQLSREVLLRATLVASANDAARSLAIDIAGSEAAFAERMNANAAALGLHGTEAANPTGLDAPGARSTARDVALLAATLMQDTTFRETARTRSVEMFGQDFPSTNIALLDSYAGAVGIKTGYTSDAGYCIAAAAERDGRLLVVAVLGAPSTAARLDASTALLDWGFGQP